MEVLPARREKLQQAFSEFEAQLSILSEFTTAWKDLDDYFAELEKSLQTKNEELLARRNEFESKRKESQEALDRREDSISAREQASLTRVQEQKDAAMASIQEERRKWTESQQGKPVSGLQVPKSEGVVVQVTDSNLNGNDKTVKSNGVQVTDSNPNGSEQRATEEPSEVSVRPPLKSLCQNMDGEGLRTFIIEHRKDLSALRKELPTALHSVIDPSRLVLKALEGYDIPSFKAGDYSKDSGASPDCRACILLLESLSQILTSDHQVVSPNIKESAKEIANRWRSMLDIQGDDLHVNAFDSQAFLQLLATFCIASEFNDAELCKLVTVISHRKDAPDLCRSLGLSEKIPDLVDKLVKGGKQIHALHFAKAFGLMDRLEPVSLLKSFLKETCKAADDSGKNASNKTSAQHDAKELSALRAVLKAVKDYNLEAEYPIDDLQKRISQLEKAKGGRKRGATDREQSKRPRKASGSGLVAGVGAAALVPGRTSFAPGGSDKALFHSLDRGQYGVAGIPSYSVNTANSFDRRIQSGYGSAYGSERSHLPLSTPYQYPTDGLGSTLYGANSAYNPSGPYGGYQIGSSFLQSAYQPFIG